MTISLEALEAALSEIEHLGHDETTFPVGGTALTMRTLSPEAEQEVQTYASVAWTDDDTNDSGETLRYVDRFRVDTLARAIVGVNGQDFRDQEYIETGETLPNGKPIKEARHKVMRTLVLRWGGPARFVVFKKYTELLKKVEVKAEKAVHFEPSDNQTEIQRLESRLQDLKDEEEATKNERTNPAHAIAEYTEADQELRKDALATESTGSETAEPEPTVAGPAETEVPASPAMGPSHTVQRTEPAQRESIVPKAAPAPPPQATSEQRAPEAQPQQRKPVDETGSFIGGDDMESAVAEANRRLMNARAQGGTGHAPAESALMAVHEARRVPPHAGAVEAAAAIEMAERQRQADLAAEAGVQLRGQAPDGTEVFSMPPQTLDLTPRDRGPGPPTAPADPSAGTLNPRFRPPRG